MSTSAPASHRFRHVARVVIEFTTPFHVGTGEGGYGIDALVVTDVNDLPTIPGSSLAGALRAAFRDRTAAEGSRRTNLLFGFQNGDDGQGSRLSLTWGVIHNHLDQPVEAAQPRTVIEADPVLRQALGLGFRDHVRLSHRGAAEPGGKFDERPVAAGHRFSFEMELVSDEDSDPDWTTLLEALAGGSLRLGGKSRRGYGAFRVERLATATFDLQNPESFAGYAAHAASLVPPAFALAAVNPAGFRQPGAAVTITLRLQPRGYWMFGGSEDQPPEGSDPADMAPIRDQRIVWDGSTEPVRDTLLLPGSAIKGALSHRVAFHYNRLQGSFANHLAASCTNDPAGFEAAGTAFAPHVGGRNPAVQELFGFVANGKTDREEDQARRGRVLLDDVFWPEPQPGQPPAPPTQRVPHVSIDRFTGGAADSKLFSERPLWQGDRFPALVLTVLDEVHVSRDTRRALRAAIEDLLEGRLALGAGAGRGLGWFEAAPGDQPALHCSAGEDWFESGPQTFTATSHASAHASA